MRERVKGIIESIPLFTFHMTRARSTCWHSRHLLLSGSFRPWYENSTYESPTGTTVSSLILERKHIALVCYVLRKEAHSSCLPSICSYTMLHWQSWCHVSCNQDHDNRAIKFGKNCTNLALLRVLWHLADPHLSILTARDRRDTKMHPFLLIPLQHLCWQRRYLFFSPLVIKETSLIP